MTVAPLLLGTAPFTTKSLLGHDLEHFEVLDGHTGVAHLSGHAHAFVDTCRRGGCTDGTRGTHAFVLSGVACPTPARIVTANDTGSRASLLVPTTETNSPSRKTSLELHLVTEFNPARSNAEFQALDARARRPS